MKITTKEFKIMKITKHKKSIQKIIAVLKKLDNTPKRGYRKRITETTKEIKNILEESNITVPSSVKYYTECNNSNFNTPLYYVQIEMVTKKGDWGFVSFSYWFSSPNRLTVYEEDFSFSLRRKIP